MKVNIYSDKKVSVDANYQNNVTELIVKFIPRDIDPEYKIKLPGLNIRVKIKKWNTADEYDTKKRVTMIVKYPLSRSLRERYLTGKRITRPTNTTDQVIESDKVTDGIVMYVNLSNNKYLFHNKINYEY